MCKTYVHSGNFLDDLKTVIEHDQKQFDEPKGWNRKKVKDSPLLTNFDVLWGTLKSTYTKELSMLAYTTIPEEQEIAKSFKQLTQKIK